MARSKPAPPPVVVIDEDKPRRLSLEYREIEQEITMHLQYGRITFQEAATWAETAGRSRDPWIIRRLRYVATLWRQRGPTTWGGILLDRQAEIPKGTADFKAMASEVG